MTASAPSPGRCRQSRGVAEQGRRVGVAGRGDVAALGVDDHRQVVVCAQRTTSASACQPGAPYCSKKAAWGLTEAATSATASMMPQPNSEKRPATATSSPRRVRRARSGAQTRRAYRRRSGRCRRRPRCRGRGCFRRACRRNGSRRLSFARGRQSCRRRMPRRQDDRVAAGRPQRAAGASRTTPGAAGLGAPPSASESPSSMTWSGRSAAPGRRARCGGWCRAWRGCSPFRGRGGQVFVGDLFGLALHLAQHVHELLVGHRGELVEVVLHGLARGLVHRGELGAHDGIEHGARGRPWR